MARHIRAQLSIFFILGAFVVLIAGMMFFLIPEKKNVAIDPEPVKNLVDSCLAIITKKGLDRVLIQGGHYELGTLGANPRIYKLAKPIEDVPGKRIGATETPFTREGIERGLEDYLSDSFGSCIGSFSSIPYPVESGNFTFDAMAGDDSVLVNLKYPLTLSSKGKSIEMSEFSHEQSVPLSLFFATINPIVDLSIKKNAIPTEKIANLTRDLNLNFSIVVIEEEDRVENMLYMVGPMDGKERVAFVIQYDWFGEGYNE